MGWFTAPSWEMVVPVLATEQLPAAIIESMAAARNRASSFISTS
jgi:hypothetical protein